MSDTELRIALITVGDRTAADRLAHALVDGRLAAYAAWVRESVD